MKVMTLKQFIHQQGVEPPNPSTPEVLVMTVGDLIDAIETHFEDGCITEVMLNTPGPNAISVKFLVPGEETECATEQFRKYFQRQETTVMDHRQCS